MSTHLPITCLLFSPAHQALLAASNLLWSPFSSVLLTSSSQVFQTIMASSQGDKRTAWTRQIIDLSGKTKTAADLDGASVSSSESALHRQSSTMPSFSKSRSSSQQQFPTKSPREPPHSSKPKPFVKPAIPASHEKSPKSSTRVKIEETPRPYISNH